MTCGRSVVFSSTPVSSTNRTDRHDIAEILLKVALNTIPLTLAQHVYDLFVYSVIFTTMPMTDLTYSVSRPQRLCSIDLFISYLYWRVCVKPQKCEVMHRYRLCVCFYSISIGFLFWEVSYFWFFILFNICLAELKHN